MIRYNRITRSNFDLMLKVTCNLLYLYSFTSNMDMIVKILSVMQKRIKHSSGAAESNSKRNKMQEISEIMGRLRYIAAKR
jgi:hypothetical protein